MSHTGGPHCPGLQFLTPAPAPAEPAGSADGSRHGAYHLCRKLALNPWLQLQHAPGLLCGIRGERQRTGCAGCRPLCSSRATLYWRPRSAWVVGDCQLRDHQLLGFPLECCLSCILDSCSEKPSSPAHTTGSCFELPPGRELPGGSQSFVQRPLCSACRAKPPGDL